MSNLKFEVILKGREDREPEFVRGDYEHVEQGELRIRDNGEDVFIAPAGAWVSFKKIIPDAVRQQREQEKAERNARFQAAMDTQYNETGGVEFDGNVLKQLVQYESKLTGMSRLDRIQVIANAGFTKHRVERSTSARPWTMQLHASTWTQLVNDVSHYGQPKFCPQGGLEIMTALGLVWAYPNPDVQEEVLELHYGDFSQFGSPA